MKLVRAACFAMLTSAVLLGQAPPSSTAADDPSRMAEQIKAGHDGATEAD